MSEQKLVYFVSKMLASVLLSALGILVFLFLFWRRLKEDYPQNAIFSTSFYMLLAVALASFLSTRFYPDWWFWVTLLGLSLGLMIGILRYKMRVFESIDATVISLMPWASLVFLSDSIKNTSLTSLAGSLVIFTLLGLFFVLEKHYKRFSWYRSGRIGFSGLTVLGLFFLLRAAVAVSFDNVLSFSGKYEIFLSAILSFLSFLLVFNLARKMS